MWFTRFLADAFARYRTRDGGGVYIAMAANTANIYAGQTIGAVGASAMLEIAQEPHLHFAVTRNGVSVDPMEFLD